MKANCVVCGKEFEKRRRAKTCGKECSRTYRLEDARRRAREAYQSRPKSPKTATCIVCGAEFIKVGPPSPSKTCSAECRRANNNAQKWRYAERNPEKVKACRQKYSELNREAIRARNRKNRNVSCAICGHEFVRVASQRYCSKECRAEGDRRIQKRYRESLSEDARERRRQTDNRRNALNREHVRERRRKWYAANQEKCKAVMYRWRLENREKFLALQRKAAMTRYESDPEAARKRARSYYSKNRQKLIDRARSWQSTYQAARRLGIPPFLFAAMQILDRSESQTQESPR